MRLDPSNLDLTFNTAEHGYDQRATFHLETEEEPNPSWALVAWPNRSRISVGVRRFETELDVAGDAVTINMPLVWTPDDYVYGAAALASVRIEWLQTDVEIDPASGSDDVEPTPLGEYGATASATITTPGTYTITVTPTFAGPGLMPNGSLAATFPEVTLPAAV